MNTIDARTLKPGQVFSATVYSEGKNVLVPAMVPLRQKDIDLLLDWGIDYVATEGAIVPTQEEEEFVFELPEDLDIDISESEPEPAVEAKDEPLKFSNDTPRMCLIIQAMLKC